MNSYSNNKIILERQTSAYDDIEIFYEKRQIIKHVSLYIIIYHMAFQQKKDSIKEISGIFIIQRTLVFIQRKK